MNNKTKIITKVNRLDDKEQDLWTTYNIGAEATNVYVRNGDRSRGTAQSLLLKGMPPVVYEYGQDIYNAGDDTFEPLTWENIQRWLNEGRIREFLKEGDAIRIKTKIVGPSSPPTWTFYVIAIDTHNGQSRDVLEKDLSHIDFGGGSFLVLNDAFFTYHLGQAQPDSLSFFKMPSNNGNNLEKGTGHFFLDSPCQQEQTKKVTTEEGIKEETWRIEAYAEQILNFSENVKMAEKCMILDQRSAEHKKIIETFAGVIKDKPEGIDSVTFLMEKLKEIGQTLDEVEYPSSLSNETLASNRIEYYSTIAKGVNSLWGTGNGTICTSAVALIVLRFSVGLEQDEFIQYVRANYDQKWGSSADALTILRLSNTPDIIIPEVENAKDELDIGRQKIAELYNESQETSDLFQFLNKIAQLCQAAKDWNGQFYRTQSTGTTVGGVKVWGLTEQEFFGQVIMGDKRYGPGQGFQYPIFNDMTYRKKVMNDLRMNGFTSSIEGGVDSEAGKPCCVTITAADNSNTDVAGVDPNTLIPTTFNIVNPGTVNDNGKGVKRMLDMPMCFRLQQKAAAGS